MNKNILWNVSDSMFNEMQIVQKELSFPNIKDLITQAVQRYIADYRQESWWFDFKKLQKQVRNTGGFIQLGQSWGQTLNCE